MDKKTAHRGPGIGGPLRALGGLVTPKVSGSRTGGAYSLLEVEVAPGGGEEAHVQHREDECFYVLEGAFEFVVEDERIEAGPGSLVYVPKGALHAHQNACEGRARMLVIHTPGGPHERFLEEASEGATDAEGLARIAAEYGIEVVRPSWGSPRSGPRARGARGGEPTEPERQRRAGGAPGRESEWIRTEGRIPKARDAR